LLLQSQEADPRAAPTWRATLDLVAGTASDRLIPVDPRSAREIWWRWHGRGLSSRPRASRWPRFGFL